MRDKERERERERREGEIIERERMCAFQSVVSFRSGRELLEVRACPLSPAHRIF